MTTTTGNLGLGVITDTVMTNKGTKQTQSAHPANLDKTLKKCSRCDSTVTVEEKCPQCFMLLTEDTSKVILLD